MTVWAEAKDNRVAKATSKKVPHFMIAARRYCRDGIPSVKRSKNQVDLSKSGSETHIRTSGGRQLLRQAQKLPLVGESMHGLAGPRLTIGVCTHTLSPHAPSRSPPGQSWSRRIAVTDGILQLHARHHVPCSAVDWARAQWPWAAIRMTAMARSGRV